MTETLLQSLQDPALYDHPISEFEVIETHISWVILTGRYAYKIKKPVDLGFLDFSSLEQRHHFCAQELALNKRLAPQLYLALVKITGDPQHPQLGGDGTVIEYAVKMAQFPQQAQLDRMLDAGVLTLAHIDAVADKVAAFHSGLTGVLLSSRFGEPDQVLAPVQENFRQINERGCASSGNALDELAAWVDTTFSELTPVFLQRRSAGYIRECHGDMHLRNIAWYEDEAVIFDCIEFNDDLRCIDVISEVAFMVMDLDDRGRSDLGSRFLNRYLEHTGDYSGLELLRFYLVYRALVRAKVDCIRAGQEDVSEAERTDALKEYRSYLELAKQYIAPPQPIIVLMFGLSGSGKTFISDALLQSLPAIRLRSDVERKRLHGRKQLERTSSDLDSGIYTQAASQQTYQHLQQTASSLLRYGYHVIVDAAFLYRRQRQMFLELSRRSGAPLVILECSAPQEVLKQRLRKRSALGRDASEADVKVLEHQLAEREGLDEDEARRTIVVPTDEEIDINTITVQLAALAAK